MEAGVPMAPAFDNPPFERGASQGVVGRHVKATPPSDPCSAHGALLESPKATGVEAFRRTERRTKSVALSPEDLWTSTHLKALGLGLFPFLLQRKQFLEEEAKKAAAEEARLKAKAAAAVPAAPARPAPGLTPAALMAAKANKDQGKTGPAAKKKDAGPKMRQLHWDVIQDTKGTIWDTDHVSGAADVDFGVLFPDLMDALAVTQPKAAKKGKDSAVEKKPKQVSMVDSKRSQNMCIMLAQFGRKPFSEVVQAVVQLNVEVVGLAGITSLLEFVPEESETSMIDEYLANGGDISALGKAEKYVVAISEVPNLKQRLMAMQVKCTFDDDLAHLREDVELIQNATREVRQSQRFPQLLKLVLQLGNVLNKGSAKGDAQGFRISNLMKLAQTKTNHGSTLLHYLILNLESSNPDLLLFVDEFSSTQDASRKSASQMNGDLQRLKKGVTMLGQAVKVGGSNPDPGFSTLGPFLQQCEASFASINQTHASMNAEFEDLVKFFGEDPKKLDHEKFFTLLDQFRTTFGRAVEAVRKEKERKEKQSRKEAEKKLRSAARAAKRIRNSSDGGPAVGRRRSKDRDGPSTSNSLRSLLKGGK